MDEASKEIQKDKILSLVNIDFNEKYKNIPVSSTCHIINILCRYREKLTEHLDFVYNVIHNKNEKEKQYCLKQLRFYNSLIKKVMDAKAKGYQVKQVTFKFY